MSALTRLRDFLTGADLARAVPPPIERRDALGALPILYQQGKAQWTEYDTLGAYRTFAISTVIYACVMLRARCLSAATVRVYRGQDAKKEPSNTHRLRRLMMNPNPFMSEAEFLSLVSLIADVANFCVIEKARAPSGAVVGLYPLRSDWLKAIPRANAAPDWEYRIPGYDRPFSLSARDVIVYTVGQGPAMSPTGFGPMNVSFREASIDKAMTDFLKAFFDNGAVPLIGLVPSEAASEMTQDDADALRERFRQLKLTGDPLVMTAITDVKRLGFDFDELAYPELRELTEQHICQAWGVPQTLIGAAGGENEATYSNAQTYLRQFYWTTVQPLWARLDGALSRSLVPEFGDPDLSLEFDTSEIDALADDDTVEREQTIKLWQTGVLVRDEVRARFGYDELGGELGAAFYEPGGAVLEATDEPARSALPVLAFSVSANGHDLDTSRR